MGRKTTQLVVLGALIVVLGAVLAYQFARGAGVPGATEAAQPVALPREAAPRRPAAVPLAVPDVKLAALETAPPEPEAAARNPFRLKPPPPPPPVPARQAAPAANPDEPPPPPPITLKFIGLVSAGGSTGKIAVLTNGPDVFYGREGDIIDGRFKIVSIGAESVVVSYADGRGTRRIALTGS